MSALKTRAAQIGISGTASQNFTLTTPDTPDGTVKLARGVPGATTADILTVDASDNVSVKTQPDSDSSTRVATTAWVRLGLAVLLSNAAGYIKMPNWLGGFIIQWGGVTSTGSGVTATWPLAFPNALFSVVGYRTSGSYSSLTVTVGVTSTTSGNFGLTNTSNTQAAGEAIRYIAIGY